jgi:hypothetical protein
MAILADTGATVLVTLNALRLLGWKPKFAQTPTGTDASGTTELSPISHLH